MQMAFCQHKIPVGGGNNGIIPTFNLNSGGWGSVSEQISGGVVSEKYSSEKYSGGVVSK